MASTEKTEKIVIRSVWIVLGCLLALVVAVHIALWDFMRCWSVLDIQTAPGNAVTNFKEDLEHFYWLYDEDWIMGKTPNEIQARYGYFAESSAVRDESGNIRKDENGILMCKSVAYILIEREPLDDSHLLHIHFDEDRRAYKLEVKVGMKGG